MCACQQGDWVRFTVPRARAAMADWPCEIIVVDDHSTDGCCHGLDRDVLILRPERRLGVSASRRLAAEYAQGDVLIFSDPHCDYPPNALKVVAMTAAENRAIVQPATTSPKTTKPEDRHRRPRMGGALGVDERGLVIKHAYGEPARSPALIGAIYAFNRRVYDFLGGWPSLPGVWGYSEQVMTLLSWFAGVPIHVVTEKCCTHYNYHVNNRFSYTMPRSDQAKNGHFVHAAFFPRTYETRWRPILEHYFGDYPVYRDPLKSGTFRRFAQLVQERALRSEGDFYQLIFDTQLPDDPSPAYVAHQRLRSKPAEFVDSAQRVRNVLAWFLRRIPGCLEGRSILDCGTRDGFALDVLKEMRVRRAEGIELIPSVVRYAQTRGRAVRQGDMRHMLEPTSSWDTVLAIHSLEHLIDPEMARDEMVRVVRPGGRILAVVPRESRPRVAFGHNSCWPSAEHFVAFWKANPDIDPTSIVTRIGITNNLRREIRLIARKTFNSGGRFNFELVRDRVPVEREGQR